ncbi:hypothetical protein FOZ63_004554 [Perkinsus olseni]|nr:hypothetical protein FOZ63_004554 [Perkinsus olseni]KAF4752820.1 hypothetical protein FOZ62_032337 [Perkinsus olseni]
MSPHSSPHSMNEPKRHVSITEVKSAWSDVAGSRRSIIRRLASMQKAVGKYFLRKGNSDVKNMNAGKKHTGDSLEELERARKAKRATIYAIKDEFHPKTAG